ncbi:MAG: hypothetical protein JWN15_4230 [Firmicutes bacterium]|nr:hypothetical protein [Bacillota bacterium]
METQRHDEASRFSTFFGEGVKKRDVSRFCVRYCQLSRPRNQQAAPAPVPGGRKTDGVTRLHLKQVVRPRKRPPVRRRAHRTTTKV